MWDSQRPQVYQKHCIMYSILPIFSLSRESDSLWWTVPVFVVSTGENFTPGPKRCGLSHSELCVRKFYYSEKYRESLQQKAPEGSKRVPHLTILSRELYTFQTGCWEQIDYLKVVRVPLDPFPRHTSWDKFSTNLAIKNEFRAMCFWVRYSVVEKQVPKQDCYNYNY